MGTDIHGVFQRRTPEGTWIDTPANYEQGRHYQLFAVLAGVRNGRGFAGVVTGEPVKPIAEPRGYPEDFAVDTDSDSHLLSSLAEMDPRRRSFYEQHPSLYADENVLELWMGDHSHSWLTGAEMLAWYAKAPTVVQTGIISLEEFKTWDKTSPPPNGWCGGISGPGVRVIQQHEAELMLDPNTVSADEGVATAVIPASHVRVSWKQGLREELDYFFDEVARLVKEHGEVRFVFGFDS